MAKGFGLELPDALLYGIIGYAGFILLKPLLSSSNLVSDILKIPEQIPQVISNIAKDTYNPISSVIQGFKNLENNIFGTNF
jgi:hypothetical protein